MYIFTLFIIHILKVFFTLTYIRYYFCFSFCFFPFFFTFISIFFSVFIVVTSFKNLVDYTHNIWVIELTNFKILWDLYLCSASYLCVSLSSLQDGYLTFYLDDGTNSPQQVQLRPEDYRDLNDWRWHKISVERMGRHVRNTSLAIFIVRWGWGWGGVQFSGFCCEYKQASKKIYTVVYTLNFVTLIFPLGGGGVQ